MSKQLRQAVADKFWPIATANQEVCKYALVLCKQNFYEQKMKLFVTRPFSTIMTDALCVSTSKRGRLVISRLYACKSENWHKPRPFARLGANCQKLNISFHNFQYLHWENSIFALTWWTGSLLYRWNKSEKLCALCNHIMSNTWRYDGSYTPVKINSGWMNEAKKKWSKSEALIIHLFAHTHACCGQSVFIQN
jgi:hypothetical protein